MLHGERLSHTTLKAVKVKEKLLGTLGNTATESMNPLASQEST